MDSFIMFYAPFIVLIISIVVTFWWVPKDQHALGNEKKSRK